MPPDYMNALLSGQNGLYSPTMGLAMGLLQAGGPSRMPVSLGQALGQGLQTGQQFQQQGLQNAMQQLMFGRQKAYVNALMQGPNGGNPTPPNQTTPESDVSAYPGSILSPVNATPSSSNPTAALNSNDAASIGTTIDNPLLHDPQIANSLWFAKMAAIGNDPKGQESWTNQARLRYDMLSNSPDYQAQLAGAKAQAEFPWIAKENYLRYAGAPKELQPGIPAVAGGAFLPGSLQQVLGFTPGSAPTFQNQGGQAVQTGGQSTTALPQGGGTVNGFPVLQGPSKANYAFAEGQGQAATKYFEDVSSKADAAQTQNNIIDQMRGDFQTFTPSKTAQYRGKAAEWLNALGFPVDQSNVGAYESSNKLGVQLQSAMTKTLGSREAAQVFTTMGNAVPNNTLAPNGFERVADFMQGSGDYVLAKKQYAQQFADKGDANGMNKVDATFQKYSNPAFFIIARGNPEQQAQYLKEMGNKQAAMKFLQQWQQANKMGLAPAIP